MEKKKREKQQFCSCPRGREISDLFAFRLALERRKKNSPQNYLLPIFKQELEVFVFVFTVPWRGRYTNSSPPLTTSRRRRSRIMRRRPLTLRQKRKKNPSPPLVLLLRLTNRRKTVNTSQLEMPRGFLPPLANDCGGEKGKVGVIRDGLILLRA